MKKILLAFAASFFSISAMAQTSVETDSIFNILDLKFSPEALANAKLEYEQANDTIKMIMLKVYSLPMSSRKELIENYEARHEAILALKDEFCKSIPKGFVVSLDVDMMPFPLFTINSIDLQIFRKGKNKKLELVDGEWDLEFDSDRFYELIGIIGWDAMTFSGIKNMMQMANCISIENKDITQIGFSRSGLGKYSYLIFPNEKLTASQIKEYNDGCEHLCYKKNIVLKYEGGMAGPQCFTD